MASRYSSDSNDEKQAAQSGESVGVSPDEDVAAKFLREVDVDAIAANATDETYAALVRKLDRRLLPLLFVTYALQCIDKSTLGNAAVFTLSKDLGLKGKQYSWLSSLFYFGYLVSEYPTTLLSQKFPIGKFVGLAIVIWGGILLAAAGTHNFAGMAVLRFLLGSFESLITPTFVLINGMYYTKREQVFRTGVWASANGFGSMVGGIIAFGMGHLNTGISGWKWIYVINGLITVLWGVVVFFYLPTSPMDAGSFLTLEERALAIHRIRKNNTGILNRQIKWNQVKEALNPLQDPQGILLFLTIFCNEVLNGGFGAFGGLTIQSFGFTSLQSTLIYIPQGFINMVSILFGGWLAHRLPNARIYVSIAMLVPTFIGLLLQIVLPRSNVAGLLTGVYLFPPFATSLFICLSLPGVNASGYTKRATLSSFAFLGYALGNISGPFMVKVGEVPAYRSVFIADIICIILQGIFLALLRIYYVRENARRDKLAAAGEVQNRPEDEFADLTDKQ
ncbi:major facilitator superfamily transporter allantoate [Mycena rosella]|uniref:Major facilitator superfamily transporter allantoate n=1 Tax=Mycena rosella TaxID=1033263 RepID=A0AAD7D2T9_MYCRO|nr:major facilitator superfamily transporter allantoate [Mycena rosella]